MSFGILALVACRSAPGDVPPLEPLDTGEDAGSPAASWPDGTESTVRGGAGGSNGVGSAAADGGSMADEGSLLTADGGWIDEGSNPFGIHGAVFAHADSTTSDSLTSNIDGTRWCIAGTAAKIDLKCEPVRPARDCIDTFFGALLSVNLNQAHSGEPGAFEPSGTKGFSFDLTGANVPPFLRFGFAAEDAATYCKRGSISASTANDEPSGHKQVLLGDLIRANCDKSSSTGPDAVTEGAKLVTLNWRVSGGYLEGTPFDFCIENFRVLTK